MHDNSIRAIDAHIHLDQYTPEDQQKLLSEAAAADVVQVVAVSMRYDSCQATHALAKAYPDQVIPAYGFHPEQPLPSAEDEALLFQWIRAHTDERFAIGEVGLPYYNRQEAEATGQPFALEGYIELLDRFVELARELDRPIVLHAVYEDADIACDLLEKHRVTRAHFHWFKGTPHTVERMIRNGYFISITPDVLYESEIQDLVRTYPIEQLMVETDGPWPFEGPFEGQQTHPKMVLDVIRAIADLKSISTAEAASILYNNTVTLYT
ncbi:TatD family hydrolase [Paenibacillus terrigena]|uniref:TatD family hydrolase n=1 Tax=Paenibacillus terrigena TaxID=369333 RepID=UPI00035D74B2|nr:TatD family hydrolase [Paenibacillus terrigena]